MKRTVAFLAAVCVSTGFLFATSAMAQYKSPPPSQPPTRPTDASGDTLATPAAEPKVTPAETIPDSVSAGARTRRMKASAANPRTYMISLGLGSGLNYKPDSFHDNFSPSLGAMLFVGARQYDFTVGVNFGYNFYLANGTTPNDLNVLTIFADVRYSPTHSKMRPYLAVCGGLFRQWIVDLDYTESVLGYGGGAGVDMEIGRTRALFFDVRYIQGQTRETENQANTEIIPMRLGVTWAFQ